TMPAETTIAAVFPDGPQRYFDTIYNDNYCREHGLLDQLPPEEPAVIDHPTDQVVQSWTRCATVVDPTGAMQ
ncbi:MAG: pyridoxal-5'-phosphate-dependent protein subunit beta, partial [Mycobacterium sp.]